ncbi:MAG: hypothetical protein WBH47_26315, partial [Streptosporangiaceae bacterium]
PAARDRAQRRQGRGRTQPARRRHPAAWAIGAAAVIVIALVVLLIVHLGHGDGSAGNRQLPGATGHPVATASPTPDATQSSPSGPATPTAFGGTWSGLVTQTQPSVSYTVTITLTSGQPSGTIAYTGADFNCSGDLSLTSATATTMTMSQGIVVGQSTCGNGTVTVSLRSPDTIDFNFQSQPAAAGTLTRE